MDINDVTKAIMDGKLDGQEQAIYDAFTRRLKVSNIQKLSDFAVGDTVEFNSQARPRYLKGIQATVERITTSNLIVRMPDFIAGDTGGRFRNLATGVGDICSVQADIVDKVTP